LLYIHLLESDSIGYHREIGQYLQINCNAYYVYLFLFTAARKAIIILVLLNLLWVILGLSQFLKFSSEQKNCIILLRKLTL